MTFLFRQGRYFIRDLCLKRNKRNSFNLKLKNSLKEKIKYILTATSTHAKNLAYFALIYKTINYLITLFLKELKQYHTMIAAFIGGYFVFGTRNNINEQVIFLTFN